jgi:hypothetical protein
MPGTDLCAGLHLMEDDSLKAGCLVIVCSLPAFFSRMGNRFRSDECRFFSGWRKIQYRSPFRELNEASSIFSDRR